MPVAYVTNKVPSRSYDYFNRDQLSLATLTFGTALDIEQIARIFAVSEPTDVLVLDGSPLISAVCLAMWLEKHGQCVIYSLQGDVWHTNLISRTSLRRILERTHDEVTNGR